MKKLTLIFILLSSIICGQVKIQKLKKGNDSIVLQQVNIPDKLNILLPKEYFEKPASDWKKDYLPAILTLIAGILTVLVNWFISKKLRESTEKNFEKQLEETKANINTQLAEAKALKKAELKASLNIKNRQEWMNQYREAISEFMALTAMVTIKAPGPDSDIKAFFVLAFKLDLLLHPERENENDAIEKYKEILELLFVPQNKREPNYSETLGNAGRQLIDLSRKILERNWQKMNSLN